ncbi:UDP-N-acetylenolpyruvoylglucosamine reductase [Candidatus Curtissbacteria bacterium RIFCSPLOWO2_01_FULL_38_11b]|uniref:UDP-N-acetylenolpyruvoylglucosamine reductase n=1 Tax=Candidatus Curtissbacteria bacterium RIFCSPLOWO2_01_FULL_38_11b TaxID=1797725 RepID=A0A1F5GZH6_9BACT|nr:MAG: UDP-N-acetylenolpyruvoylglucosamine reductase [Candidatus Curtissbacteria bacterium RIFCSPLOWO2_01_FULL_38_11b]
MNQDQVEKLKETLGPLRILENEPLSKHTYFKIGGPAKIYFEAKSLDDLSLALETALANEIPFVVLGAGANVLVSDYGFEGLVIKNQAASTKIVGFKGTYSKHGRGIRNALVLATSGTLMNQLARFTLDQGLEGLEFLLSVPGTLGGGLKINAHFEVERDQFIGNRLVSATLFDPKTVKTKTVDSSYFNFAYDYSRIQQTGEIVLDATFRLDKAKDPSTLWQKAMDNVKRRNEEQPVGIACSGCIFKNISDQNAIRLATPNLTTSAGYVIESLNLKGTRIGGAEISSQHANFILNTNNATSSDVLKLINLIKDKAKNTYGLELKEEIFYIGDFSQES